MKSPKLDTHDAHTTSPATADAQNQQTAAEITHPEGEAIREVVGLLKRGDFSTNLQRKLDRLWQHFQQVDPRDWRYYKVAAMVSEVNYYLDRPQVALAAVHNAPQLLARLERTNTPVERKLVREQLRCCQAFAQAEHYRKGDYLKARDFLIACRRLATSKGLKTSYGTRAQNSYYLGKTHRQMDNYALAEKMFRDAIDKYQKRAEVRAERRQHSKNEAERERLKAEENLFITRRVAIALGLGLGWLDYTRGHLDAAYEKVLTAKALLSGLGDELNTAYLDLICGSIWRCQAGSDFEQRSRLKEAREIVKSAYDTFEREDHTRYKSRAAYELALINLALADPEKAHTKSDAYLKTAEKRASEVFETSRSANSWRWMANARIVQSRIERKKGELHYAQAERLASRAFKLASDHNQTLCMIDALIARAEVKLLLAKETAAKRGSRFAAKSPVLLSEARGDLEAALVLNTRKLRKTGENEKIRVVCSLLIAKTLLLEDQSQLALERCPTRDQLREIEHTDIQNLAQEVEIDIRARLAAPFSVPWDTANLSYHALESRLKDFLLMCAWQRGARSHTQMAKLLGVQRAVVRQWLKTFNYRV